MRVCFVGMHALTALHRAEMGGWCQVRKHLTHTQTHTHTHTHTKTHTATNTHQQPTTHTPHTPARTYERLHSLSALLNMACHLKCKCEAFRVITPLMALITVKVVSCLF